MTIKDIAKLAGVSVSTVSKVINGKDDLISPATREKILGIVKEYHYAPYAFVGNGKRSYLIGALLRDVPSSRELASKLAIAAESGGYHVVACFSDGTDKSIISHLAAFARLNADVIVTENIAPKLLEMCNVKVPVVDIANAEPAVSFVRLYEQLALEIAEMLVRYHHERIACIVSDDYIGEAFASAFKSALYIKHLQLAETDVVRYKAETDIETRSFLQYSAIACSDIHIAVNVYKLAQAHNLSMPIDISVISVKYEEMQNLLLGNMASASYALTEYADNLAGYLIGKAENTPLRKALHSCSIKCCPGDSLITPQIKKAPNILVIGAINIDIYIAIDEFPREGISVNAYPLRRIPGGKAVNQAITAARMGANTHVIGRIGNDDSGRFLYKTISDITKHNSGIFIDPENQTGTADVLIKRNGESSVVLYAGANEYLSASDIQEKETLFHDVQCCLLQTETGVETALCAAALAKKHNCKTVLKPSNVHGALPQELLDAVDYLVPNINELSELVGSGETMEEKVAVLRETFHGTLLVTCAEKGCYVCAPDDVFYCSGLNVEETDAIGASDVFIGVFVCYLSEGRSLREAVVDATYAAGYSITVQGATSAFIDKQVLEALKHDTAYQVQLVEGEQ